MPINALTAGVAALAINSTAFTIEIFRGGFAAVPVAQHDAARARRSWKGSQRQLSLVAGICPLSLPRSS
jgi:ABC-type amino acid transport system permease subunit